jgi:subtilisin-like proprotein convertase family protein
MEKAMKSLCRIFSTALILIGAVLWATPVLAKPNLNFSSLVIHDGAGLGNNNGNAEPDECIELDITLKNVGNDLASGISATLVSNSAGVTIPAATATLPYPNIPPLGSAQQLNGRFRVSISPAFTCGNNINLTLNVSTGQGPFSIPVSFTGGVTSGLTFNSTSTPVAIPDFKKGLNLSASKTIVVNGVASFDRIKVSMRTTHTYDADLDVSLIAPDNTEINLSSDNGEDGNNFGTDCPAGSNDTTFDDQARVSIVLGSAPFVGTFRPEQPLSTFNAVNPNGTWTLRVVDDDSVDEGNIECWSIRFESYTCNSTPGVCNPGSVPVMHHVSNTVSGGNGNSVADFNEIFDLDVQVRNDGTADATGVSGTLSTTTPGVTVLDGTKSYPNINTGAAATNANPFSVKVGFGFPCGTEISFTLTITTDQSVFAVPFKLRTGLLSPPVTFSTAGPPVPIPDGDPKPGGDGPPADLPLTVSGLTGLIGNVDVSMFVTHTYDSDLDISLIGTNGLTKIDLSSDNGTGGDNYGQDCTAGANDTTFDDAAAVQITEGDAPFVGSFAPEQPLSTFNLTNPNGVWKLRAIDDFAEDIGNIECWSMKVSTFQCQDAGAGPSFFLFDDFENGVLTWPAKKGTWKEQNGKLQNEPGKSIIEAPLPWSPSGFSTCSTCSREFDDLEVNILEGKITITAWEGTSSGNKVEIKIKLGSGKVIFKQKVAGITVAKSKGNFALTANTPFDFKVSYDGTKFDLTVGGSLLFSVNSSNPPSGNIGIKVSGDAVLKIGEARIQ